MAVNIQEFLLGTVVVLGGWVWRSQDARIKKLEARDEARTVSEQTLREAVVKLTVTVEYLAKHLGVPAQGGE